jgi:hypothetical protein
MQSPRQLNGDEFHHLEQFRFAIPRDKSEVTCVGGQKFTFSDHCSLAYSIWQRMGKNDAALHRSWCAMMQSNPSQSDIMALVAYHVQQANRMDSFV